MRKYETIVILDPDLSKEERDPFYERIKTLISQQGFMIVVDEWGTQKLAYEIKKKVRGHYVRFEYCGTGALVAEMERLFRIDDRVLKYLTVLLEKEVDVDHLKKEAESKAEEQAEKPPAQAKKPPAQAKKPPAQAKKPPAQAGKPPAQAEKPPAQAEKSPAQAEKPPAQAEKPPAQAGKPPAQAEKPPAQAEKPPAQEPPAKEGESVEEAEVPSDDSQSEGKTAGEEMSGKEEHETV